LGVALLGDCAEQLGRKPEILERRIDETLLVFIRRRMWRGCAPLEKPLLNAPGKDFVLRTGSGGCASLENSGNLRGTAKRAGR
jgi:hypothetical protein